MSWKSLLNQGELDDLRAAAKRNLEDAAVEELSDDNRFAIAYQAALISAKMAIACAGYRVKGAGAHHTTFEALPLVLGSSVKAAADYFDRCRRKRNVIDYDSQGVVSSADVEEIIKQATELSRDVEMWISKHHPTLA
jgi:hypothetical protein